MQGLDRITGGTVSGVAWLEQQIDDILTTRKTERTMRADYGSDLPSFIDRNINDDFTVDIVSEVNDALAVLADVFRLTEVSVVQEQEKIALKITGIYLESGEEIQLNSVFIN